MQYYNNEIGQKYPNLLNYFKNGIKDDNRIENLVIMTNAEHTRLHHLGAKRSEEACRNISMGKRAKNE